MISLQVDLGNDSLRVLLNMGCFCLVYARPILHRYMQKQQTQSLRLGGCVLSTEREVFFLVQKHGRVGVKIFPEVSGTAGIW